MLVDIRVNKKIRLNRLIMIPIKNKGSGKKKSLRVH